MLHTWVLHFKSPPRFFSDCNEFKHTYESVVQFFPLSFSKHILSFVHTPFPLVFFKVFFFLLKNKKKTNAHKETRGRVRTTTPLLKLNKCNMIRSFPGSERMHFADKGVFGKLKHLWVRGYRYRDCRMTAGNKRALSTNIRRLRLSDLKRRLRDLRYIEYWKEHKMLLQATELAVLKYLLKPEM